MKETKEKYTGLTKEQMLLAMIDVATFNEYIADEDDEDVTFDEVFTTYVNAYLLEEYFSEPTESEKYIIEQVSNRGAEGDGADMFLTFKITDKETGNNGYLEFSGRYSSWDSSEYNERYVVQPEEVVVIQYNKIK